MCNAYANQGWFDLLYQDGGYYRNTAFKASYCRHCKEFAYWYGDRMIVPASAPVEVAHPDLPHDLTADYSEAREIVGRSPRSAAALMRLVVQKLMPLLGQSGKNLNEDIGNLVAQGLPSTIQQALDICRVVGNNAVHPGEIDLTDTPEIAHQLFAMVNFIVEDRISRPKQVAELYARLPAGARDAVAKRDLPGK